MFDIDLIRIVLTGDSLKEAIDINSAKEFRYDDVYNLDQDLVSLCKFCDEFSIFNVNWRIDILIDIVMTDFNLLIFTNTLPGQM